MPKHEQVMSVREAKPLVELEETIARGKKRLVEMGWALGIVRDLRLYKREYSSFDEYCRAKWGCGRHRAYRLIDAAGVAKVSPMGDKIASEVAARELAKTAPAAKGHQLGTSEQKTQVN